MIASFLTRKIPLPKVNWWLWLCISVPAGIWLLRMPQDRGASREISDWDYWIDWIRHYQLDREFWRGVSEAAFMSFGFSFALGLVVQCVVMAIWQALKSKKA